MPSPTPPAEPCPNPTIPTSGTATPLTRHGQTVAIVTHHSEPAELERGLGAGDPRSPSTTSDCRPRCSRQLDDLRASRARIVATADARRRRLERDLHDGAQQRLLAFARRSPALSRRRSAAMARGNGPKSRPRWPTVVELAVETIAKLRAESTPTRSLPGDPRTRPASGRRSIVAGSGPLTVRDQRDARPASCPFMPPSLRGSRLHRSLRRRRSTSPHRDGRAPAVAVASVRVANAGGASRHRDRRRRRPVPGVAGHRPRGGSGLVPSADRVDAAGTSIRAEVPV